MLLKRVESDINFLFSLQHGKRIAFWQIYPCILNVPITLYACFQTLVSKKKPTKPKKYHWPGLKKQNKVIAHIAVLLTLVILVALAGMRLPKSIEKGARYSFLNNDKKI